MPNESSKPISNNPNNPEIIKSFLTNQRIELENQKADQDFKIQELQANSKLSEQSIKYQSEYLKAQPEELRKTFTRLGYILAGFVIIFLAFMGFCLWMGKDEFV